MSTESIDKILPFECSCGILHQIKIPVIELFKRREISTESIDDKQYKILDKFIHETEDLWEQFMEGIDPNPQKYDDFYDNARNKARQAIADLIKQSQLEARIDELNRYDTDKDMYKTLRTADLQNQVQAS